METVRPIVIMVLFLGLCSQVFAQKHVDTQHLLWTRYFLKLKLNDNYQILQELEERTYWFPWRQHAFDSKTHLECTLGNGWSAGVGLSYFLLSLPSDPKISDYHNQTELRPQLEVAFEQLLSKTLMLHHRYWSEFRFFEQPEGKMDYETNRMRYKLELRYAPASQITLKAFDEILLHVGGNTAHLFDQNRIGGSVQYMPVENFGLELGYFNLFQKRASGVDYYNRHIVRLTIYQNIHLKHPKNQQ